MKITVTTKDIADGKPGEECGCPIALAISRAAGCPVTINESTAFFTDFEVSLPDEVGLFIRRFDRGEPVKPFVFHLDVEGVIAV